LLPAALLLPFFQLAASLENIEGAGADDEDEEEGTFPWW
ncbi:unnamed protein product, partial [Hapterophycus canaliculatus]